MGAMLTAVILIVLLIAVIAGFAFSRYRVAGPNEAIIVTGRKGKEVINPETGQITADLSGQKVVMGAGVFVWPIVQKSAVLDLSARQIAIHVGSAVSSHGIKVSLEGVAIVKVGGSDVAVRSAAQRFLGQQDAIEPFTQEVLAGSLRAIVGRLSIEEVIKDRAAFAREVAEEAETSLTNQGLVLDTFQLQDIQAEGNYLRDLGRPEAARVEKEGAVAEAAARREAEQARIKAEEEIAVAQRELELRQASIQAETDAAKAEADAAGPIAKAARDQDVIAAQEKVAERQALLKERQLDTEIRRPADAQRYAVEQDAQAEKTKAVLAAEAEKSRRAAAAEAVKLEGEADASAIAVRGDAEASAMEKKAAAYAQYGDAAIVDLLAEMLPQLVREAAAPLSAIDKVTVISTDGASQLTKNVAGNVTQGMQLATDLLGIDLAELFQRLAAGKTPVAAPVVADGEMSVAATGIPAEG